MYLVACLVFVRIGGCFFGVASCMLVWNFVGDAIFGFEFVRCSALCFFVLVFISVLEELLIF